MKITMNEFRDLGFRVVEVISSVQEVWEVNMDLDMDVESAFETYSYDSKDVETVYDMATTSYDVYFEDKRILLALSNHELIEFINEEEYKKYLK